MREATKRIISAIDQIGGDRRKQIKGLWKRKFPALKSEAEVYQAKETRDRIMNNNVDLFIGEGNLVDIFDLKSSDAKGSVVRVCRPNGCIEFKARYVCIATGSRASKPTHLYTRNGLSEVPLEFKKGGRIVTATEMGGLMEIPSSVAIFGGGVIAVEYATVLSKLGVGVSIICKDNEFVPFLEPELCEALKRRMRRSHVLFVNENVKDIEIDPVSGSYVKVSLHPPDNLPPPRIVPVDPSAAAVGDRIVFPRLNRVERKLKVDLFMYSAGRDANSEGIFADTIQCTRGKYGRLEVNHHYRTDCLAEVYAVGDVIGPPGLASAAQLQARTVADDLFKNFKNSVFNKDMNIKGSIVLSDDDDDIEFDETDDNMIDRDDFFISSDSSNTNDSNSNSESNLFSKVTSDKLLTPGEGVPLTLWTIPEIASVGLSITQASVQYKSSSYSFIEGYAYFKDMARGRLSGDMDGFLKIVALRSGPMRPHKIIGVFIFGEGANELIQLGSVLVNTQATIEQVSRTPFAAVTLCGLFQMACDDALVKISKLTS